MNSILKYLFVVINLLLVVVGVLIIGFILWINAVAVVDEAISTINLDSVLFYGGIILGSVLVFIGLWGAIGAIYEKKWILIVYLVIILLIVGLEIAAIVYGFVKGSADFVQQLESVWTTLHNNTKFIIQDTFQCCGYLNSSEWNGDYDVSCLNTTPSNQTVPWQNSCSQSLLDWYQTNFLVVGGAAAATVLFQLIQVATTGRLIYYTSTSHEVDDKASLNRYLSDEDYSEMQPSTSTDLRRAYNNESFLSEVSLEQEKQIVSRHKSSISQSQPS